MRLIDGTIQALPMSNYILERKDTFIKVLQKRDNDFLFAMLMDHFNNQPTAYDEDKVVELLEKQSCDTEIFEETPTKISGVFSYDLKTHKMVELADAIQIVKDGGVKC